MKSPRLEKLWSSKWEDIYVATEEDKVSPEQLTYISCNDDQVAYQYEANQGQFELVMPKRAVYEMDVDTTVELIAQHIADLLKSENPENEYKVIAYEGVAKGAIAYA